MTSIAQSTVFWPGISHDIERERKMCQSCNRNAPSQPRPEPIPPIFPTTPFEAVVADYFVFRGMNYIVIADRLSAWTECYRTKAGTDESGSRGLILLLKKFFGTFGVPREMSSDGGKEFVANETQEFMMRWGVQFRLSAAYNPQSNGRAELAVKSTKRLIEDNVGPDGELDTDKFLRAILIKSNTPDPTSKLSPAEIVFGRKLRDTMPRVDKSVSIFFNSNVRPTWTKAWEEKELAQRTRYQSCQKRLAEHSKALPSLEVGDRVSLQNQAGNKPAKWGRTGTIVELRDFDKYIVKVDGSWRLTLRNRRFLKKLYEDKELYGTQPQTTPQIVCDRKKEVPDSPKQSRTVASHRPQIPEVDTPVETNTPSASSNIPSQHTIVMPQRVSPCKRPSPPLQPSSIEPGRLSPVRTPQSTPMHRTPITAVPDIGQMSCDKSHPRKEIFADDRPSRNRSQRLFYDADKGGYVPRNPGSKIED